MKKIVLPGAEILAPAGLTDSQVFQMLAANGRSDLNSSTASVRRNADGDYFIEARTGTKGC